MIDHAQFFDVFNTIMRDNGFSEFANEEYSRKFYALTERMLSVNEKMNLTAIKDEAAVILLHYADSLTAARFLPQNAKMADIGCGAGFPCLPLAICRPDLEILALDSTEKRIQYVKETAELLGCTNLTAMAARAEEAARGELRERFDVCTARAVAALPALSELCLPFVRVGGTFLAMKGPRGEEEAAEAASAIRTLGGSAPVLHTVELKGTARTEERTLIEIKKDRPPPAAYPRPWAKILKKHL